MRMLWAAGLLVGCASAEVGAPDNPLPDSPGPTPDGPEVDPPDTQPPGPVDATLQQTTNTTIATAGGVSCNNGQFTSAASWFRVFSLAEAGITDAFAISKVTIGVQFATNEPPVTVRVGTYGGTPDDINNLDLNLASFLANTTAVVTNTAGTLVDVPITATIPANGRVIVEIASSTQSVAGNGFILGTSSGPFQHTSYFASGPCTIPNPIPVANACTGCGAAQAIITVTGTH